MTRYRRSVRSQIVCAPLLLLGSFSGSIAQGPDFHEAVVANRVLIDSLRVRCAIPGLSVSVFHNGRIAWSESFGYADLESLDPATPASRFRIASLSKVLTGTAVAKLREQGDRAGCRGKNLGKATALGSGVFIGA